MRLSGPVILRRDRVAYVVCFGSSKGGRVDDRVRVRDARRRLAGVCITGELKLRRRPDGGGVQPPMEWAEGTGTVRCRRSFKRSYVCRRRRMAPTGKPRTSHRDSGSVGAMSSTSKNALEHPMR